jgi:hypothetical protein
MGLFSVLVSNLLGPGVNVKKRLTRCESESPDLVIAHTRMQTPQQMSEESQIKWFAQQMFVGDIYPLRSFPASTYLE